MLSLVEPKKPELALVFLCLNQTGYRGSTQYSQLEHGGGFLTSSNNNREIETDMPHAPRTPDLCQHENPII